MQRGLLVRFHKLWCSTPYTQSNHLYSRTLTCLASHRHCCGRQPPGTDGRAITASPNNTIAARIIRTVSDGPRSIDPQAADTSGELVYTGNANRAVFGVKCFSLGTSAIGICLQPWLLSSMTGSALVFKVATFSAAAFFVLGTPCLLHFICKRYVMKLYYNKETNTFTAEKLNFLARRKTISFKPSEIKDSLPNPFSNFEVGDQGFLMDTDVIKESHPDVYIAFMRYDEPIDLSKYGQPSDSVKK